MPAIILDVKSTQLERSEWANLQHPETSGVILFGRNCDSLEQTRALTDAIREVNPNLVIYIDQEGGRVQRLKDKVGALPAMNTLGLMARQSEQQAKDYAFLIGWLMASHVKAAGVDVSFAPVLDRDYQHSKVIGDRAFADSIEGIVNLASEFMRGMNEAGMATVGKHFPGHGFVVPDSHLELPIDERPFEIIAADDMVIFERLSAQLSAVMPAHIVFEKVHPKPTCFSDYWLQNILRKQLAFEGLVFSDDLSMQGAAVIGGFAERVTEALQAGCDQVLVCNTPEAQREALQAAQQCQTIEQGIVLQGFKAVHYPSWDEVMASPYYKDAKLAQQALNSLTEKVS